MSSPAKVWFITGTSTPLGRAVTEHALQQGDNVVAIAANPEELSDLVSKYASQLLVLPSDVRDPAQTHAAFENALERFGRVDIVFNNVGFGIISEAESMSEEQGREIFESIFWGTFNVTKEVLKTFRDRNSPPGGRLLQISSWATLKAVAGIAHYSAANAAVERFTEGMAVELDPNWNIKISIVQPPLLWAGTLWSAVADPVHPAYGDPDLPSRVTRNLYPGETEVRGNDGDVKRFARAMRRLAYEDDPPFHLPLRRVSVEAAKVRGEGLIQTAKEYASWSDDVYFSQT